MDRILIVEDDGYIFKMIQDIFSSDLELVRARGVDEAIGEYLYNGPFNCFIIDLQIIASGLTEDEMVNFQSREGYALLKNYIWKNLTEEQIKTMKSQTIICSRYINDFKKEYDEEELLGLTFIIKKAGLTKETRLAQEIKFAVEKICKSNKNE